MLTWGSQRAVTSHRPPNIMTPTHVVPSRGIRLLQLPDDTEVEALTCRDCCRFFAVPRHSHSTLNALKQRERLVSQWLLSHSVRAKPTTLVTACALSQQPWSSVCPVNNEEVTRMLLGKSSKESWYSGGNDRTLYSQRKKKHLSHERKSYFGAN